MSDFNMKKALSKQFEIWKLDIRHTISIYHSRYRKLISFIPYRNDLSCRNCGFEREEHYGLCLQCRPWKKGTVSWFSPKL